MEPVRESVHTISDTKTTEASHIYWQGALAKVVGFIGERGATGTSAEKAHSRACGVWIFLASFSCTSEAPDIPAYWS